MDVHVYAEKLETLKHTHTQIKQGDASFYVDGGTLAAIKDV